ncbi:MAG: PepSY-like domain-containing protein [Syntrophothermus sp.]
MKILNLLPKLALSAIVLTAGLSFSSYAQAKKKDATKNVPQAVLDAFKKAYPNAVIKGSGKETEGGKTLYEIESVDGKSKRDLLYLPDGKVAEIEELITEKDLPAAVKESIKKETPKGKITKAEKITKDGNENYELIVKEGKKSTEILLNKDGKVEKKESLGSKKENDKEEDEKD